jgi:RND family efflux transporter MFP subunit
MNEHPPVAVTEPSRSRGRLGRLIPLLALIVFAGLVAQGVMQRRNAAAKLARWTDKRAIASVALVSPRLDSSPRSFILPGRVEPFYDAAIDAQVSGYVKEWRTDYGANVKKGETLAVIDTPDLDQRIAQARQWVAHAKSAEALADLTSQRWSALRATGAVSQQASDATASHARVEQADVAAAVADLNRLLAWKAFTNVVAPFDGVVTARNIDIGSYVTDRLRANKSAPMFKVADIHAMRVYVNAPENYAADLHAGVTATLVLSQQPDRVFHASVVTTSHAIDVKSRMLLVELNAANPDRALTPGAYVSVRFSLPKTSGVALHIPSSALAIGPKGPSVATIVNGRARFKKVVVAHDYGVEVEVASGVSPSDWLIDNPGDGLADGDPVRIGKPDRGMASAAGI